MLGSLILNTVTRAAFPTVFVFSVYLLFTGHNAPGGGFVGGLVAGAALVLRYAGQGLPGLRAALPRRLRFELLLGWGLMLAAATVLAPLLVGEPLMTHHHWHWYVGVLGEVKLATPLFFDTGVYLIVVGLVLGSLDMLGRDPHAPEGAVDHEEAPVPPRSAETGGRVPTGGTQ